MNENCNNKIEKIFYCIKLVPLGRVVSLFELARVCENCGKEKTIFKLIKNNIYNENIQLHRIVDENGALMSLIKGGKFRQRKLLENEGVEVIRGKVDLSKYGFIFW